MREIVSHMSYRDIRKDLGTNATFGCNAARCGRMHCHVTGPLLLLAALYVVLGHARLARCIRLSC